MLRAFLRDIDPREARGLVITTYRSTAITISVIMLQIPNSAPQKAYNSQPGRGELGKVKKRVNTFTDCGDQDEFIVKSGSCSSLTTAGNTLADYV